MSRFCHAPFLPTYRLFPPLLCRNSHATPVAAHTKPVHRNLHHPFPEKPTLRHWFVWLLLVLAMFYGMHRYFEYRERELDKRIEQMYTDH
jgi:hypothetical protein